MKKGNAAGRASGVCAARGLAALALVFLAHLEPASAGVGEPAVTFYVAKISSAAGWEDVAIDPVGSGYVGAYLAAGALSGRYARFRDGALQLEAEGQLVRHFGQQQHWEFNGVPVVARWQRFPWNRSIATSAAFGLGLSYATELPPVEVRLEGESSRFLVYWVMELTAGSPDGPWAASLRLHHRSVAYGLMGEEGGMNAVGLGVRYRFGAAR